MSVDEAPRTPVTVDAAPQTGKTVWCQFGILGDIGLLVLLKRVVKGYLSFAKPLESFFAGVVPSLIEAFPEVLEVLPDRVRDLTMSLAANHQGGSCARCGG